MKIVHVAGLSFAAIAMLATAVMADTCSTGCNIQTKKAAAGKKGQFDYTLSCIRDSSGDEWIAKVTAATDALAKTMAAKGC